jgi:hypothetical protein
MLAVCFQTFRPDMTLVLRDRFRDRFRRNRLQKSMNAAEVNFPS